MPIAVQSIEAASAHADTAKPESGKDIRRYAFVAAARTAFLQHGYAATTMSAISSQVGGSKTTLWNYFPSKEDLFTAVIDDVVEQYGSALTVEMSPLLPVATVLERFAAAMLSTVLSPVILNLHRVVTGEVGRFPEIGRLFYERGARRAKALLGSYMEKAMENGGLRRGDPAIASRQFAAMCQSNSFQLALYGVEAPLPDNVARDITSAIDSFMRAWGPEAA